MISGVVMHILVALVWMFLSGNTGLGGLIAGLIAGFLLLSLFKRALFCTDYVRRVIGLINFLRFFFKDVAVSNFRLATLVFRKDPRTLPGYFIRFNVEGLTAAETVLLSHFIGLTPGTTVATLTDDGKELVLHIFSKAGPEEMYDNLENGLVKHMLAFTR